MVQGQGGAGEPMPLGRQGDADAVGLVPMQPLAKPVQPLVEPLVEPVQPLPALRPVRRSIRLLNRGRPIVNLDEE